ncbi:MAG: amino acid-binding protein [Bacillota bacterium]|nr:amino acid-binding protein [Bacillota bacterium]
MAKTYITKQLSVFLENKSGSLDDVLGTLAEGGVNIVALSLADTADYGLLRMIVSDPEKGRQVLKEDGVTAMLSDVIAFKVSHRTGSLCKAMNALLEGNINIEYMYCFANGDSAAAVLKADSSEVATKVLLDAGFEVYSADEAYVANMK